MMKSALKRTRDPAADGDAHADSFIQPSAPSPAPKRIAWGDQNGELATMAPNPSPRSRLQISQPNFPTYQIRRHESTVDLSTLLFGSPSASAVPNPQPPPPTFTTPAPEMDGQQQEGGMRGFFGGLKSVTRRLLSRSDPGIARPSN